MSLSDQEKSSCRHHLGYPEIQAQSTYVLGVPASLSTQFALEGAFNLLLPTGEDQVRRHLRILDFIEELDVQNLEDVEVSEVEGITIDADFYKKRWAQYRRWRASLANIFGIIPNPYEQRGALGEGAPSWIPRI